MPSGREAKGRARLPKPNVMSFPVYLWPSCCLAINLQEGINLMPDSTEDRKIKIKGVKEVQKYLL